MIQIIEKNENEQVVEPVKPYSFRELCATDIAPMCAIIGKIGINNFTKCFKSDELLDLVDKNKGVKNLTNLAGMTIAFEMANTIISNIPNCEKEIFDLLASVSGLKVSEIKAFGLTTFTEMIIDFVKKEEFKDFFRVVSKLFS